MCKRQNPQLTTILGGKSSGAINLVYIPKIDEMLGHLNDSKFFTSLDLRSRYYHIKHSPKSGYKSVLQPYLASTSRLPFGLAQGPVYFPALMQNLFGQFNDFSFFHMDDELVQDTSENDHLEYSRLTLQKIREAGLKLKLSKCAFSKGHLQYLGHIILGEGKNPSKQKLETILNLAPLPEM